MRIQFSKNADQSVGEVTDFTYDAQSKLFIYSNGDTLRSAPEISSASTSLSAKLYQQSLSIPQVYSATINETPSEADVTQSITQTSYHNTMRFSRLRSSQQGIAISPSGLTVASLASYTASYAVCALPVFEKPNTVDAVYFELIFPNGCEGLEFGLLQTPANLEQPQTLKTHLVSYKYKTPKVIGVKIDTKNWVMKVWLNGEFQPLKSKNIAKGSYAFCIKMTMKGFTCILNPFASDPERSISIYTRTLQSTKQSTASNQIQDIKGVLDQIQSALKLSGKQNEKKDDVSTTSSNGPELTYLIKNSNLIAVKGKRIKLLRKNAQGRYPLHFAHFLNRPKSQNDRVFVTLLLGEISTLTSNADLYITLPNAELFLTSLHTAVAAQTELPLDQARGVPMQFIDLKKFVDSAISVLAGYVKSIYELICPAKTEEFGSMKQSQQIVANPKNVEQQLVDDELPFFEMNEFSDSSAISCSSEAAPGDKSPPKSKISKDEASGSAAAGPSSSLDSSSDSPLTISDLRERVQEIAKQWDIHSIHNCLYVLLKIDEQLFAMTLHEDSSAQLRSLFSTGVARLFSAFGRLASLYSFASQSNNADSLETIAEIGLINPGDLQVELKHFLDFYTPLQAPYDVQELLSSKRNQSGLSDAEKINQSLDTTVNAMAYEVHKRNDSSNVSDNVKFIRPNRQYLTNYCCSVASDGSVNVWNAELVLKRVTISDFKDEFVYPQTVFGDWLRADLKESHDIFNKPTQNGSDPLSSIGSALHASLYKILENAISQNCKHAKKPKPKEKQLVADPEKVEHLLQLGFSVSVAKRACIEVKNESIEKALDEALKIQNEEQKQQLTNKKSMTKKSFEDDDDEEEEQDIHVNQVKPFWDCELCTYQNVEPNVLCEMCQYQAPESAFYSEAEVMEIKQEKQLQKQVELDRAQELIRTRQEEERKAQQIALEAQEKKIKLQIEQRDKMNAFLSTATAKTAFLMNLSRPSFAQVLVGVALNSPTSGSPYKSLLRIRRFAVNPEVLSQFYSLTENGILCNINGQYLQDQSLVGFENMLFSTEENRYVFETLAPIHAEDPKKFNLLAVQEANIVVEDDLIVDCSWRLLNATSVAETYEVVILGSSSNNSFNLHQFRVKIDTSDPYNLQHLSIEPEFLRKIRVSGPNTSTDNSFLLLPDNSSMALIISQQKLIQIPIFIGGSGSSLQNETIEIKELTGNAKNARFISPDQIAILDDTSTITVVDIRPQSSISSPSLISIPNQFNHAAFYSKQLASFSSARPNNSPVSSQHTFDLNQEQNVLEIELATPITISALTLAFRVSKLQNHTSPRREAQPSFVTFESETSSDPKNAKPEYLPSKLIRCSGSPYSHRHHASSILLPNQICFQSFDSHCSFLLSHSCSPYMIINAVTIHSSTHPVEGAYPIGSALIFTSDSLTVLEKAELAFSEMTHERYEQWKAANPNPREWEPVGSVMFSSNQQAKTVNLDFKRCARYILIMPTSLRSEFIHLKGTKCTAYEFFGLHGFSVDSKPSQLMEVEEGSTNDNEMLQFFKDNIIIDATTTENNEWQRLDTTKVHAALSRNVQVFQDYSLLAVKQDTLTENREIISTLERDSVAEVSLKLNQANNSLLKLRITIANLKAGDNRQIKTLTLNVAKGSLNCGVEECQPVDLSAIIKQLLSQQTSDVTCLFEALVVNQQKSGVTFKENLLAALIATLPSVIERQVVVTYEGQQLFWRLLKWCSPQNSDLLQKTLLEGLQTIANQTKQGKDDSKSSVAALYNSNRQSFEPSLFGHRQNSSPLSDVLQLDGIDYYIQTRDNKLIQESFIDLRSSYDISHLGLQFAMSTMKFPSFRVIVTAYSSSSQTILSKSYDGDTFYYQSNIAHDAKKYFSDSQSLLPLLQSSQLLDTRYLVIQVSYSLFAGIGTSQEISDVPLSQFAIIPIIKGTLRASSNSEFIQSQPSSFPQNYTEEAVLISSRQSLPQQQIGPSGMIIERNNKRKISQMIDESIETQPLVQLQQQLRQILNQSDKSIDPSSLHRITARIEQLQIIEDNNNALSLSYLHQTAISLSQFLRHLQSARLEPQNNAINVQVVQDIFESFVVFDCGQLTEEILQLLDVLLLPALGSSERLTFVSSIVSKYLMTSETPSNFSQTELIQHLTRMSSLPTQDIFSLFTEQLPKLTKNSAYITIAPTLALLNLSFNSTAALTIKERIAKYVQFNEAGGSSLENEIDCELPPVGVKRSISHPKKEEDKNVSKASEIVKVSKQQSSFSSALKLCYWLAQNSGLFDSDEEYEQLTSIAFNLLTILASRSPLISLKSDLFAAQSDNLLDDLFSVTLTSKRQHLLEEVTSFIKYICSPQILQTIDWSILTQEEKAVLINEKKRLEEIQFGVTYCLEQIAWDILTSKEEQLPSTQKNQLDQTLKLLVSIMWSLELEFVSQDFLQAAAKRQLETNSTEDTKVHHESELASASSMMTQPSSNDSSTKDSTLHSFTTASQQEKKCTFSSRIPIEFFSNATTSIFAESADIWRSMFGFIQLLGLREVLSSSLIQRISSVFLSSRQPSSTLITAKTKSILLQNVPELLSLTGALLYQGQKLPASASKHTQEFSEVLLTIAINEITEKSFSESSQLTPGSADYSFISGLFDILISGASPKPESFYSEAATSIKLAPCKLSVEAAAKCFERISKHIRTSCSFGGLNGILISDTNVLVSLQLTVQLVHLFLRIDLGDEKQANCTSVLFASKEERIQDTLARSFKLLIEWYLLNKSDESKNSAAGACLTSISRDVLGIFSSVAGHKNTSITFLRELLLICAESDQAIQKITSETKKDEQPSAISALMAQKLTNNASTLLSNMFDLLVSNDEIASFVAFDQNGFQFILEKMGLERRISTDNSEPSTLDPSKNTLPLPPTTTSIKNQMSQFIKNHVLKSSSTTKSTAIAVTGTSSASNSDSAATTITKKPIHSQQQLKTESNTASSTAPKSSIVAEEFGTTMKLVKYPGNLWTGSPTNWCEHQAGVQNMNIIWASLSGKNHSECVLTLQLEQKVFLSSLRIGFNSFWTDYDDKVLGIPSSVFVEFTSDLNLPFQPLSQIPFIADQGYESVRVRVAAKNFERLEEKGNIEAVLTNSSKTEVKYLRLRMTRPVVNFLENGSVLQNKIFDNIAVSISFISVVGYATSPGQFSAFREKLIADQDSSGINLIGKLCNQSFNGTLNRIANSDKIIEKIQRYFDVLSNLLTQHESCLAPVFLAIAGNNQSMGDWILSKFLDLSKMSSHAKMVSEIVCSQLSYAHSRVEKVHQFVLTTAVKEILAQHAASNQVQATFKFTALLPFVETWATSIQISALDYTTNNVASALPQANYQSRLYLPVNQEIIDDLIAMFDAFFNTPKHHMIVKMLVIALNLPKPYVIADSSVSDTDEKSLRKELLVSTLSQLWTLAKTDSKYYELIAPLILSTSIGVEWFLADNAQKLLFLFGTMLNLIKTNSHNSQTTLLDHLVLVSAVTTHKRIQQVISEANMHVNFYNCLKDTDVKSSKFLKQFYTPSLLGIVVEILKNVTSYSQEHTRNFAKILSDDINVLTKKRDMIFVANLLVPLLNSERMVSVAFHPYDTLGSKWLAEGRKVLEYKRDKIDGGKSLNNASAAVPNLSYALTASSNPLSLSGQLNSASETAQQSTFNQVFTSLTTKLFTNAAMKKSFQTVFEKCSKKSNLYQTLSTPIGHASQDKSNNSIGKYKYMWQLALTVDKDSDPATFDLVKKNVLSTNYPFAIIMECLNEGKNCVSGVFSSSQIQQEETDSHLGKSQIIKSAKDNFLFYYEDTFQMNFDQPLNLNDTFGMLILDTSNQGLQFNYLNNERIYLSFNPHTPSIISINPSEMTPSETNPLYPKSFPSDQDVVVAEYWVLKPVETAPQSAILDSGAQSSLLSNLHNKLIFQQSELNTNTISNYFRSVPVYSIPECLDIETILSMMNVGGFWLTKKGKEALKLRCLRDSKREELKVKAKISDFVGEYLHEDGILDLQFDALDLYDNCHDLSNPSLNAQTGKIDYHPAKHIFDEFQLQGGVQQIIQVIQSSFATWKNSSRAVRWEQYMKELKSFSSLPNYFSLFMKNKECIELLFELLAGLPDEIPKESDEGGKSVSGGGTNTVTSISTSSKDKQNPAGTKKWDEEEQKAVHYSYQVLKDTFKLGQDNSVRQFAFDNKLIEAILDRIALVSKEVKRVYTSEPLSSGDASGTNEESDEVPSTEGKASVTSIKESAEDETKKKPTTAKKGIGYGSDSTGQNQKWNTNEYIESNRARSESLQNLIAILEAFFDFNSWEPPKELMDQILSSALLPLIESSLRSGSLLEMSKEKELILTYLRLIRVMSKSRVLVPCFLPLDERYLPKQTESVYELLGKLRDTAKIFLNCMGAKTDTTSTQEQQDETAHSKNLADQILLTEEAVGQACKSYELDQDSEDEDSSQNNSNSQEEKIKQILELPLSQKYKILLQDLRFDYTSFKKESGKYNHHYQSSIQTQYTPPQAKMVRLAQELADISTALPIDHTNSIFVRCDSDRVDVMKCLVMGAEGTPYGNGAFVFDVYFGDDYPNGPPKCNLETTGAGKVRFNPNLYACGKVCLSLLGTWRGNASENWDPKISTLLQILVSLQAIIMSDDVYFNEPGFEGEAGTEEGMKKNEGYSNIVKYCNIKYAMINQIKNPPEGFEQVIQRHFFLKKAVILEECKNWLKNAETRKASYIGLVNDHNSSWCGQFKTNYTQMLSEAIQELEEVLNSIPAPNAADMKLKLKGLLGKKKKGTKKSQSGASERSKKEPVFDITQGVAKIDEIDVEYDDVDHNGFHAKDDINNKNNNDGSNGNATIDINDEKVKDRWSRYIGAMGIDAVAKQSKCSVFLAGMGALGVEIAKNIVMSGVKRLTIQDSRVTTYNDLSGQFYLGEEDVGKNRAEASLKKIRQLNHYVKVDTVLLSEDLPSNEELLESQLKLSTYDIVVLTDVVSMSKQITINEFCRSRGIKFISADVYGPWCRLFNDFGDSFEVIDKNGDDPVEVMIRSITSAEKAVVTLLPGVKHPYEDGEHIILSEIQGMESIEEQQQLTMASTQSSSINGTIHKVRVINSNSFEIGDTRGFKSYVRNGIAKNIKTPVQVQFKSLREVWDTVATVNSIDENLAIHDFEKIDNPSILFIAFHVLDAFQQANKGSLPDCWSAKHTRVFLDLSKPIVNMYYPKSEDIPKNLQEVLLRFALTVGSSVGPLAAFLGGFVTQEIVKAITNKYLPTRQLFFSDCMEVIFDGQPKQSLVDEIGQLSIGNYEAFIEKHYTQEFNPQNTREDGIRFAVGNTLLKNIKLCNLFMVGCGAIGCELLKNFAMIGLGTGEFDQVTKKQGMLTITDPDHIEVSNLNRQFLFREKHLRKPKSQTGAASAIQMNPLLKGHILARLDKVYDGTINIFSDSFFSSLDVVANALDNVQARRYMDTRCVTNKKPLLESGTLGPKGHVQVILPYSTESYGSQQDPQEEGEIPHCTLKMFPEETLHCVEWARDKFGKLFTLRPKSVVKIIEDSSYDPQGGQEMKELKEAMKLLEKRPKTFEDCIAYAVRKFYKYFRNDIKQLMFTYPIDSKLKDGEPFWKLPKRPPTETSKFDPSNSLHRDFVTSLAVLRAKIFKIAYPKTFRSEKEKAEISSIAALVEIEEFKPSEEKAQSISSTVDKDNQDKSKSTEEAKNNDESETANTQLDDAAEKTLLLSQLAEFKASITTQMDSSEGSVLLPEEFEKDEDDNGHIDLIYAMANCRSANYRLAPMEWIQVKLKAGRIVPALATTTATIAGLQTIELIKVLKQEKLVNMKNTFLNLAVPLIQLTEPQKAEKIQINENLGFTLWDRWDINRGENVTLNEIFTHFATEYKLSVCDIMHGSKLVYSSTIMDMPNKEGEKQKTLASKLIDLIDDSGEDYVDFIFTFANLNGEKIKKTPLVRVNFK